MSNAFRRKVSFLSNILLALIVAVLALHKWTKPSAASNPEKDSAKAKDEVSLQETATKAPVPGAKLKTEFPRFTETKSPSDRRRWMIDQLRLMGVPNEVLGRVARVDFEAQWESRFDDCHGDMDKLAGVQLKMSLSKDAEMRAALGEKDFKQWDQGNMLWEAMSTKVDVNPTEADAIYDLKKKLQQRQLELEQGRLKGTMDDAEINHATDAAYAEFNQKMRDVLGDARFAKSQQIDDAFATDTLRHELAAANPSDSQVQELYGVEKEWNKARAELDHEFENDMASPEYLEKARALASAHDQEFQRVLGTDAFNDYQKQQDATYTTMKKFETLWGLDSTKVDYVYGAMKQYQKNVEDYQVQVGAMQAKGQSVDWDAVNNNLQQFANQTQQAIQTRLGANSFNKLQRSRLCGGRRLATSKGPPTAAEGRPSDLAR